MPKTLKLLIVMPSGKLRGGAEEALVQFLHCGPAAGLDLTVAFLEEGDFAEKRMAEDARTVVIPSGRLRNPLKYAQVVGRLRALIRNLSPDAVVSWMTKAHAYAGVAARLTGVPAIYFQMGLPDGGSVDRISRLVPAAGAVACSEFVAEEQRKFVSHPVIAVPLAADHARFSSVADIPVRDMKARMGLDPDRPVVGIVGRLQRWKGMHVFAEAMAAVFARRPDCQAVIIGGQHDLEPDYPAFLERRIAELGLTDRIVLAGAQRNVPEWMQAMDIVIHASEREPFGIVVIEGMCLGKPVIAAKPGGPEEIVQEGMSGLLVPFGDAPALAGAILRYLDEPDFARRCGEAARTRAGLFTPEKFTDDLRAAVIRLTGGKG